MIKGSINNIVVSRSSVRCDMLLSRFSDEIDTTSQIFKDWRATPSDPDKPDQALYVQIGVTFLSVGAYVVQFRSMDGTKLLIFNVNSINKTSSLSDERINSSYFGRMIYITFMNKILPILINEINNFHK